MKAMERVSGNNKIGIICEGNDVSKNKNCSKIEIKGKQFKVLEASLSNSLTNTLGLWLVLDVKNINDIPLGPVRIIS